MKKILITSGGTREYIDGVRVLTNISSGKLGAKIADYFLSSGDPNHHSSYYGSVPEKYDVHYVYVKGSEFPSYMSAIRKHFKSYEVTDVQSVYDIMEKLVPEMDIVIHPMAVSDFGFKPINTKLKSNDTEAFIESMKERIYQTPKILSHIKEWNSNCFLISFKFEDGLTHEELIKIAADSQLKNKSDIVIANDKKEMQEKKSHIAYFLKDGVEICSCNSKEEISYKIFDILNK